MKVGDFQLDDSAPEMRETLAFAMLSPWVDVGKVGTLVLNKIEEHLGASELGRLARPGKFINFTEVRPTMRLIEGRRVLNIPNSVVKYARNPNGEQDCIFLHLREPQAMAEDFIDSVIALLKHLNVTEYCRIGSMYDYVPHSRPLKITGTLSPAHQEKAAGIVTIGKSNYQGPTSIVNVVSDALPGMNIESTSLMVHLPHYATIEEDYAGASRIMDSICALYGFPESLTESERGEEQYFQVSAAVESSPEAKKHVTKLEADYDRELESKPEEPVTMSPGLESFLQEMGERLDKADDSE